MRGKPCRLVRIVALVAVIVALSCGGPSEPRIVQITGRLVSPNGAEGAAVLTLTGTGTGAEGIQSIRPVEGDAFIGMTGPAYRVVLVRKTAGEIALTFLMNDNLDDPAVTIEQVAGPDDALRSDLSGYRMEFER